MTESADSNVLKTVYDSTTGEEEVPIPGGGLTAFLAWVSGVILGILALYRGSLWLAVPASVLVSLALFLRMGNDRFEKQKRHREWAANGDFEVIDAEVEGIKTQEYGHKGSFRILRTIRVGSLEFSEPDDCSYPFRELRIGSKVRVTHHGQEVIKMEVRAE